MQTVLSESKPLLDKLKSDLDELERLWKSGVARSASRNTDNTPLHKAADAHLQVMTLALRAAFNVARKALKTSLRAAGDAAGHEFHGNQYTSGGGGKGVFYHGTSTARLQSILKEGITTAHTGENYSQYHKDSVYLATTKEEAVAWGRGAAFQHEITDYAVLEVHIPKSELGKLADDPYASKAAAKYKGNIKPEWIKGHTIHSTAHSTLNKKAPTNLAALGDVAKVWVAVVFPPDMRSATAAPNISSCISALHAALLKVLPPVLVKVYVAGANAGVGMLPKRRAAEMRTLKPQDTFNIRFDQSSPEAIAWAKKHAGELAVGISGTTEQRIKDAIAAALEGDGLDAAYEDILAAVGDSDRADLIARNEVMTAANEGQREAWGQAVDEGLLPPDATVEWIATSDACPDCEALDGTTRPIDGEYDDPDAGDGPPLHPNCRCTEGISA